MPARAVLPLLLCVALGCGFLIGTGISDINARPAKYYQHKVSFRGEIVRSQRLASETLLEVEDERGSRILVRSAAPVEFANGDWIRVRGILVPDARVGDVTVYDVVMAEEISGARAPRFRNLF
ncbi:MAG TPA: hypothetical protein VFD84_08730 [Candidatus Binatia bacterium]|nr:hypothetical protein [Candidatus Binatia bacterium]